MSWLSVTERKRYRWYGFKPMQGWRIHLVLATLLCAFQATAQDAIVRSVRMVPDPDGPTIEIVTTRPLSPEITLVENPTRLVIDLSKAILPAAKVIPFHDEAITGVRVNQNQINPAITRIVVDLTRPIGYSWDAAGNRLMIRLRPTPIATATATSAAATSLAPASTAPGTAITSKGGTSGGSAISAGTEVAVMRLPRGGEVHVCPGTTVSVTYSQSGRDLMLGMSTGSLETDYSLGPDADSILTPDFRILMAGPGAFHYAISADSRGNTCVRSLPGNTASVIVSELMGDKTYQVTPSGQAYFHSGRLENASTAVPPDCGCPAAGVPVLKTADTPTSAAGGPQPIAPHVAVADPGIADLPPPQKNLPQVSVDAPFVFRASDPPPAAPAPTKEVAGLAMTYALPPEPLEITVLPPPPPPKTTGFFGKVKGFFSGIFGK
jgi:hypothetical protein